MKKKITFFYPPKQDTFLRKIIKGLQDEYEVEEFTGGDEQYFFRTLTSSDICWFEWGGDIAQKVSRMPMHSKYVVRMHSFEFFEGMHHNINWRKIKALILVNDSTKEIFRKGIPGALGGVPTSEAQAKSMNAPVVGDSLLYMPDEKIHVIYQGIETNKYVLDAKRKMNKKVALIGYLNFKKAPELALQCFEAITEYDPEFTFHIAGLHQDMRFMLYLSHLAPKLKSKIYFDGWQENMNAYLQDKDFVLSSSLFESFQFSLVEGMATGCTPLVHDWFGASNIYPDKYLWRTIPECVDIVKRAVALSEAELEEERTSLRGYVEKMYSFDRELAEIKEVLRNLK
jgi:glycosyltransferase involved in cell wall biosynthesis